jgi:hypothetical protein
VPDRCAFKAEGFVAMKRLKRKPMSRTFTAASRRSWRINVLSVFTNRLLSSHAPC